MALNLRCDESPVAIILLIIFDDELVFFLSPLALDMSIIQLPESPPAAGGTAPASLSKLQRYPLVVVFVFSKGLEEHIIFMARPQAGWTLARVRKHLLRLICLISLGENACNVYEYHWPMGSNYLLALIARRYPILV